MFRLHTALALMLWRISQSMHANGPEGWAIILECFFARFGLALSLLFKCSNVFYFDLFAPRQTVAAMNDWHLRWKIGRSDCIFQRTTAWSRQLWPVLSGLCLPMILCVSFLTFESYRMLWSYALICLVFITPGMDERRGRAFESNASAMSSRGAKGLGCWLWRQGAGDLQGRALREWLRLLPSVIWSFRSFRSCHESKVSGSDLTLAAVEYVQTPLPSYRGTRSSEECLQRGEETA